MSYDIQDLNIVIEFSIGLAGFSAIVSVFLQRGGALSALQRFRILSLLNYAISPAFASFFFFTASHFDSTKGSAVRISAFLFGVWIALTAATIGRVALTLPTTDRRLMNQPLLYFSGVLCVGIVCSQITVAAGLASTYHFALFYTGLVASLLVAVIQFTRIVVSREEPNDA